MVGFTVETALHVGWDGRWLDVRLEYMNDWVLIHNGLFVPVRYGVSVRI